MRSAFGKWTSQSSRMQAAKSTAARLSVTLTLRHERCFQGCCLPRNRYGSGAGLGRLQLDAFVFNDARLPRPLHLLSRRRRPSPRLSLSVLDVRAVCWGQMQFLIRAVLRSAHQLSNSRVTRFINAARLAANEPQRRWNRLGRPTTAAASRGNVVLSCGVGNHGGLRGLLGGAEGIRTSDLRSLPHGFPFQPLRFHAAIR
jgi:hypothetical protein